MMKKRENSKKNKLIERLETLITIQYYGLTATSANVILGIVSKNIWNDIETARILYGGGCLLGIMTILYTISFLHAVIKESK